MPGLKRIFLSITQGNRRSVKAKKNILGSFGIKGIAIIIGFIKVPILLSYLDAEKYGIWLTIASIVDWVHYFDLGIGHGLRNKFAEALAKEEHTLAHKLVSTAYYYITIIFSLLFFLLTPIIFILNWQSILNTTTISQNELTYSVLLVLAMFVLRFILYQISVILKGDQRPALSDIFLPISNIITLIIVILLGFFSRNSLLWACLAISVPPSAILLLANLYFFNHDYKCYRPMFNMVDKSLFKDTFTLGLKFFIIQLSGLVLYASSNIILTQVVSPSEVTLYNISRQYYTIPFMIFGIILTPFWSAITDAYVKGDISWIRRSIRKLLMIGVIFCLGELFMLIVSPWAFHLWLGDKVDIPFLLSLTNTFLFIFNILGSPFSHFLNGVGKLKVSVLVGFIQLILFIPIATMLCRYLGASGLVLSLILVNSLQAITLSPLQYFMIISGRAKGIWNK